MADLARVPAACDRMKPLGMSCALRGDARSRGLRPEIGLSSRIPMVLGCSSTNTLCMLPILRVIKPFTIVFGGAAHLQMPPITGAALFAQRVGGGNGRADRSAEPLPTGSPRSHTPPRRTESPAPTRPPSTRRGDARTIAPLGSPSGAPLSHTSSIARAPTGPTHQPRRAAARRPVVLTNSNCPRSQALRVARPRAARAASHGGRGTLRGRRSPVRSPSPG